MAIRDRDVAAEIIGVKIFATSVSLRISSSMPASLAPVHLLSRDCHYEQFTITVSVQYLAMIIIGGWAAS